MGKWKKMDKKIFVAGIVLMLVGTCTASMSIRNTSDIQTGKNIYVDGKNTEGPWDGTAEHPYQYIRDGVQNASDGDTILVAYYIYFERNLLVNKSVNLIGIPEDLGGGTDLGKPVIDANATGTTGNVIKLETDEATISGFVIKRAGLGSQDAGIKIWGDFDNNTISDNEINNCSMAGIIFNNGASGNIISGNKFRFNKIGINCGPTGGKNIIHYNSFYKDTGATYTVTSSSSTGNTWNLTLGNYWSDYTGVDANHDGIGDTPYEIPGSSNEWDYRPLMSEVQQPPVVKIIRPLPGSIYIFDKYFGKRPLNTSKPFILFPITIVANASSNTTAIVKFEFYIDGELKYTSMAGENGSYSWLWNEFIFDSKDHTIKVIAYDLFGSTAEDQRTVWKLF